MLGVATLLVIGAMVLEIRYVYGAIRAKQKFDEEMENAGSPIVFDATLADHILSYRDISLGKVLAAHPFRF